MLGQSIGEHLSRKQSQHRVQRQTCSLSPPQGEKCSGAIDSSRPSSSTPSRASRYTATTFQPIRILTKEAMKLDTKLRHVDIHQHWLFREVQQGRIAVQWLPIAEMPADGLTKSLPSQRQSVFVKHLNLVDISSQLGAGPSGLRACGEKELPISATSDSITSFDRLEFRECRAYARLSLLSSVARIGRNDSYFTEKSQLCSTAFHRFMFGRYLRGRFRDPSWNGEAKSDPVRADGSSCISTFCKAFIACGTLVPFFT